MAIGSITVINSNEPGAPLRDQHFDSSTSGRATAQNVIVLYNWICDKHSDPVSHSSNCTCSPALVQRCTEHLCVYKARKIHQSLHSWTINQVHSSIIRHDDLSGQTIHIQNIPKTSCQSVNESHVEVVWSEILTRNRKPRCHGNNWTMGTRPSHAHLSFRWTEQPRRHFFYTLTVLINVSCTALPLGNALWPAASYPPERHTFSTPTVQKLVYECWTSLMFGCAAPIPAVRPDQSLPTFLGE